MDVGRHVPLALVGGRNHERSLGLDKHILDRNIEGCIVEVLCVLIGYIACEGDIHTQVYGFLGILIAF